MDQQHTVAAEEKNPLRACGSVHNVGNTPALSSQWPLPFVRKVVGPELSPRSRARCPQLHAISSFSLFRRCVSETFQPLTLCLLNLGRDSQNFLVISGLYCFSIQPFGHQTHYEVSSCGHLLTLFRKTRRKLGACRVSVAILRELDPSCGRISFHAPHNISEGVGRTAVRPCSQCRVMPWNFQVSFGLSLFSAKLLALASRHVRALGSTGNSGCCAASTWWSCDTQTEASPHQKWCGQEVVRQQLDCISWSQNFQWNSEKMHRAIYEDAYTRACMV